MATVFFTGFPGFLGSALVPRVLARGDDDVVCLVQPRFADLAAAKVKEIVDAQPELEGRIRLVEGDITASGLGLENPGEVAGDTVEIFHLAAVYDLAVSADVAQRINVEGTRNVLDFAEDCPDLRRHQYVSTCYVSGRYPGIFREDDLDVGQTFNNHYEETKFRAESEVQERMQSGIPTTVYRPAVVVGDSQSGATQKFDGPYFILGLILRQGSTAVMPVLGDPSAVRFNVVPRDFVIDAIDELSGRDESENKVYALADPRPLSIAETIDAFSEATGKRIVTFPLPWGVVKRVLDVLPADWLLDVPKQSLAYFTHPTHYSTAKSERDLAGTGIEVPSVRDYLNRMVEFMQSHPEIGHDAMI